MAVTGNRRFQGENCPEGFPPARLRRRLQESSTGEEHWDAKRHLASSSESPHVKLTHDIHYQCLGVEPVAHTTAYTTGAVCRRHRSAGPHHTPDLPAL